MSSTYLADCVYDKTFPQNLSVFFQKLEKGVGEAYKTTFFPKKGS